MMRDLVAIIAPIVGSVLGYMSAKMERKGNEIDLSREIKKSVADNESLRIENSNLQIEVNNLKEKIRILESNNDCTNSTNIKNVWFRNACWNGFTNTQYC